MRYTNWHVITGAPCSGKTSVINALEQRGYRVVHEVSRAYIDSELQKGKQLAQIKSDIFAFEQHILNEKVRISALLPENEMIFLDRGVPDSIAYFRADGIESEAPLEKSLQVRYKAIFYLKRLKFQKDPVRSEDDREADRLGRLLKEAYRMLEYDIVSVPLLPVEDRVRFILQHVEP